VAIFLGMVGAEVTQSEANAKFRDTLCQVFGDRVEKVYKKGGVVMFLSTRSAFKVTLEAAVCGGGAFGLAVALMAAAESSRIQRTAGLNVE